MEKTKLLSFFDVTKAAWSDTEMIMMRAIGWLAIFAVLAVAGPQAFADPPATQSVHIATTQIARDLNDQLVSPLQVPAGHRAVLLLFISSDCPISNGYAPTIAELFRTFTPKGVDCFTVYCDASLTLAAAKAHHDQYQLVGGAVLDPKRELAAIVDATHTPEAVVVGPAGMLLYRGRIDDLYVALGRKRFAATTHELRDVLNEVVAGQVVDVQWWPAIGCEIN